MVSNTSSLALSVASILKVSSFFVFFHGSAPVSLGWHLELFYSIFNILISMT